MSDFPVTALRSVDLDVPDLAAAETFYTTVWGLAVAERRPNALYLHATGADHHVLVLHQAETAALRAITFRATPDADLAALGARALAAGGRVIHPPQAVDWPGGGTGITFLDNQGRTLRVVQNDTPRTPDAPTADRATHLSHVNINSTDTAATVAFLFDVLGFRLTDRSKLMAFVRCNSDHHVVVIADAAATCGLNHVAFMMPSLEAVMRGAGRLIDHGTPIAWGVGRHGPGDNVFAYFIDPFGIVVEYTAEVLQVDDAYRIGGPGDWTWPPGRTDHWGIAPPKSEACKHAQLAIPLAEVTA